MSIRKADLQLSSNDKQLLKVLSHLILDQIDASYKGNISCNKAALTDDEADRLLKLLEQILKGGNFLTSTHFVEALFSKSAWSDEKELKTIYMNMLAKNGRSKVMPTFRWNEFQLRLGIGTQQIGHTHTSRMTFDHFLVMERKVFEEAGIHPRVCDLLMKYIETKRIVVSSLIKRENHIAAGTIKGLINKIQKDAKERILNTVDLYHAIMFVSNAGVLFTTRDWGVAGTISMLASASIKVEKL